MKDNKSEEVSPQQGEDLRAKYVPGVWCRRGALFELRYSSTGVPIFIERGGAARTRDDLSEFELVEAGATLDSPLFRGPHDNSRDDAALLQLTAAALSGAVASEADPRFIGVRGVAAARAARAALAELRRLGTLSSEETP